MRLHQTVYRANPARSPPKQVKQVSTLAIPQLSNSVPAAPPSESPPAPMSAQMKTYVTLAATGDIKGSHTRNPSLNLSIAGASSSNLLLLPSNPTDRTCSSIKLCSINNYGVSRSPSMSNSLREKDLGASKHDESTKGAGKAPQMTQPRCLRPAIHMFLDV